MNTDSFTVGEFKEVFFGMRIFELAKQTKSMRHYVWSGSESIFRVRSILLSNFLMYSHTACL